jgi:hypothetical protein
VPAHQPDAASQAVIDLVGTLTRLRELGLRGDCLTWVSGCEAADVSCLSDLLALGHATGTAVLLSTTSPGVAAELAVVAGLVVASGPITDNLTELLADLAVGTGATAPAMGHELPIEAPLWARSATHALPRPSPWLQRDLQSSQSWIFCAANIADRPR